MKRSNEVSVSAIVKEIIKDAHIEERLLSVRINNDWERIVGTRLAMGKKSVTVKKGVVHVIYNTSVGANEILALRPEIITRIKAMYGEDAASINNLVVG